jgi:hypothetical protein
MSFLNRFRILKRVTGGWTTAWRIRKGLALGLELLRPRNLSYSSLHARQYSMYLLGALRPVEGQTDARLRAAIEWMMRAQHASGSGGVSYGYFPAREEASQGWLPPYPETTGYIMQSLVQYAHMHDDAEAFQSALRMAQWEVDVQLDDGSVRAGFLRPGANASAAFNTGMVLIGWATLLLSARGRNETRVLTAARRAADWLVADMDADGNLRTHGPSVTGDRIKTFTCLCGWGLHLFADVVSDRSYADAALRLCHAAIRQQRPNGWFDNNNLGSPEVALTHTIGYTLQGILQVALLSGREDMVHAVRRGTDPLLGRISRQGYLHGMFNSAWEPAVFSSCLTGSAQLAGVCYLLYEHTSERRYLEVADRLMNFLKALQPLDSALPGIHGALAGSFPLTGGYQTGGYPNWATKFFADSLMMKQRIERAATAQRSH